MGGFERGDDAFGARKKSRGFERGSIGDGGVFGAAFVGKPGMFGADGGVVETCGNGMRGGDLAVFGLQNVRVGALQDSGACAGETLMRRKARGVLAKLAATPASFDADHFHRGIAEKLVKEADGIRTAANAREKMRRQTFLSGENLFSGFAADDRLKIADHGGIRMRSENGAE